MYGYILPNFPFSAARVANRSLTAVDLVQSLQWKFIGRGGGREAAAAAGAAATATRKRHNIRQGGPEGAQGKEGRWSCVGQKIDGGFIQKAVT